LDDVRGLKAFGALDHFEFDCRTLLEVAIALALNGGIVDKHVFTLVALDESVPLGRIEPLDSSSFSVATHLCFYSFEIDAVCSPGLQAEIKSAPSVTRSPSLRPSKVQQEQQTQPNHNTSVHGRQGASRVPSTRYSLSSDEKGPISNFGIASFYGSSPKTVMGLKGQ
jgi:hypothetical protein